MFDNIIKANRDDIIKQERYSHTLRMLKFYWSYTHKIEFLYKYQKALKEYFEYTSYITKKYLNNIKYDYIITDVNNSNIYYYDNKTMEDFYVSE